MVFTITITAAGNSRNYVVTHLPISKSEERFQVQHETEVFLITSNRPHLRTFPGFKKRVPKYELLQGDRGNTYSLLQQIYEAIWQHMKKLEASGSI
jgi:hypothetical protein